MDAAAVDAALPYAPLIERIADLFREGCEVPVRHHHPIRSQSGGGMLLLMPAWQTDRHIGIKIVTVFGGNAARGLPSVLGAYLLLDGASGEPKAMLDGPRLTLRRTAAASALAARFLAREDASRLLMVGAGALAPHVVRAHAAVRPIREVRIWNRSADKAEALAAALAGEGIAAHAEADLAAGVGWADIVSCATLAAEPLVRGDWLRPGTHVDLIGGFTPTMREADDTAMRRAALYVDTRAGALKEAGDLVDPIARGVVRAEDVRGDLFELCRGEAPGRRAAEEITLFKSVGTALEDLAAATLCLERA